MIRLGTAADPYDLWMTPLGIRARRLYYGGKVSGTILSAMVLGTDWLAPHWARRLAGACPTTTPIAVAHEILTGLCCSTRRSWTSRQALDALIQTAATQEPWAWGLGFPWMSKNGFYGPDLPFITHTPYVLEALLGLRDASDGDDATTAQHVFDGSYAFLDSLGFPIDTSEHLAIRYAPVPEPRIVVNASTYAALAYALHASHGTLDRSAIAADRIRRLVAWVVDQQRDDGSWTYYADDAPGNFIDGFHTFFILKNFLKLRALIDTDHDRLERAVDRGWYFVRNTLVDCDHGLIKRFAVKGAPGPFRWDLYDQAEYLGLLIDLNLIDEACAFRQHVEGRFRRGESWWCRIDVFGRRWGRGFLRWGILPFHYHSARLERMVAPR